MRAIYNELRLSGLRVWIDEQLKPGAPNWQHEISQMLDFAECVVCWRELAINKNVATSTQTLALNAIALRPETNAWFHTG